MTTVTVLAPWAYRCHGDDGDGASASADNEDNCYQVVCMRRFKHASHLRPCKAAGGGVLRQRMPRSRPLPCLKA
jgi:hypothetical protein